MEEGELQSWFIVQLSQKNYTICLKTNLAYFTNHEARTNASTWNFRCYYQEVFFTYSEVWFQLVLYVEHKWGHIQLINKTIHAISRHIQSCITACCLWLSKIFIPLGCIRFFTDEWLSHTWSSRNNLGGVHHEPRRSGPKELVLLSPVYELTRDICGLCCPLKSSCSCSLRAMM